MEEFEKTVGGITAQSNTSKSSPTGTSLLAEGTNAAVAPPLPVLRKGKELVFVEVYSSTELLQVRKGF